MIFGFLLLGFGYADKIEALVDGDGFGYVDFGVGEAMFVGILRFLGGEVGFGWTFFVKSERLRIIGYANFELAGRKISLKI